MVETWMVALLGLAVTTGGGIVGAYVVLRERIKGVEGAQAGMKERLEAQGQAILRLEGGASDTREAIAEMRGTLEQLIRRIDDVLAQVREGRA